MQEFNRTSVNNDVQREGRMDAELPKFTPKREERKRESEREREVKILARRSLKDTRPLTPLGTPCRQSEETSRKSEILLKTFPSASRTESGNSRWGLNFSSGTKGFWSPGFNELADFRYPISVSRTGNVMWASDYARSSGIITN